MEKRIIEKASMVDKGSMEHLWVLLSRTIRSGDERYDEDSRFFSLAAAFCELFATLDLRLVDPVVSGLPTEPTTVGIVISDTRTGSKFGEIQCNRPGHGDISYDPGIYLVSCVDFQTLRALTGLPFPDNMIVGQSDRISLADYSSDFATIVPTEAYQTLRQAAAAFRAGQASALAPFTYELTLMGTEYYPQKRDGSSWDQSIVEHRFFEDLRTAVVSLLTLDCRHFNPIRLSDSVGPHYDLASLTNTEGRILAQIVNIPIDDSPNGEPCPGVWLFLPELDLATLQMRTGIDFSGVPGVDQRSQVLQLAEFTFDRGYNVYIEPKMTAFLDRLSYATSIDPPCENFDQYHSVFRYRRANSIEDYCFPAVILETFSDSALKAALERLLLAEIWLMVESKASRLIPHLLAQASICDKEDKIIAFLSVDKDRDQCIISMVLSNKAWGDDAQLQQRLFDELYLLGCFEENGHIRVPIASIDTGAGMVNWLSEGLRLKEAIRIAGESKRANDGLSAAAVASQRSLDKTEIYTIDLDWSAPLGQESVRTASVQIAGLFAAHDYLLRLDGRLFLPTSHGAGQAFLKSASLRDGADESVLVRRSYRQLVEGESNEMVGFYLSYHPGSADALVLEADASARGFIQRGIKGSENVYRQIGYPAPQRSTREPVSPIWSARDCYRPRH